MAWLFKRSGKYTYKGKVEQARETWYVGCRVNGKTFYTKVIR